MLIRQINNGQFVILKDNRLQKLYSCLEELQLWKGENPFDTDAGVDYYGIFENRVFIESELIRVLDKHKEAYSSYTIQSINVDEQDRLWVALIFKLSPDLVYNVQFHIGETRRR